MDQIVTFMLREREVAARLRVSVQTLRRLRRTGLGPAFCKIGKQIRYPVADCEAWLAERLRQGTHLGG